MAHNSRAQNSLEIAMYESKYKGKHKGNAKDFPAKYKANRQRKC